MQLRLLTILLLLVACGPSSEAVERDPALAGYFSAPLKIEGEETSHDIVAYLAVTERQRQHGLMFVRQLPDDHGMLFIYDQPRHISMWMKNTFIPLDMLFIRADGVIDSIVTDTTPHSLDSIRAANPVVAVLELNAGSVERLGIKPGDRIIYRAFTAGD